MRSEKLELKLIEHRARKFAGALSGARAVEILELPDALFATHWRAIRDHCGIDARPCRQWMHPVDERAVLDFLSERMRAHGRTVHVPFEEPITVKVDVSD